MYTDPGVYAKEPPRTESMNFKLLYLSNCCNAFGYQSLSKTKKPN